MLYLLDKSLLHYCLYMYTHIASICIHIHISLWSISCNDFYDYEFLKFGDINFFSSCYRMSCSDKYNWYNIQSFFQYLFSLFFTFYQPRNVSLLWILCHFQFFFHLFAHYFSFIFLYTVLINFFILFLFNSPYLTSIGKICGDIKDYEIHLLRYEEEVRKSDFCSFSTSSVRAKEALVIAGQLHEEKICEKIEI